MTDAIGQAVVYQCAGRHRRIDRVLKYRPLRRIPNAPPVVAALLSWPLLLVATVPGVARAACPSPTQPLVVDLSLQVGEPAVQVGDLIEVELVARSSDPILSQSVAGLDAIIGWDSTVLAFCTNGSSGVPSSCEPGVVDGDYNWNGLVGPFVDDTNVDGLNNDLTDGLILYSAFSQFGNPAIAPPEGLVVARFSFRALSTGTPTTMATWISTTSASSPPVTCRAVALSNRDARYSI
jgi:hypothetical protein